MAPTIYTCPWIKIMIKWWKESWKTTKNVFLAYDFSYATDLKRAEGKDGGRGKRHWALWAIQPSGERKSLVGTEDATRARNSICKVLIPIIIAMTKPENPVLTSTGRQPAIYFYTYHFRAVNGTGTDTKSLPTGRWIHISSASSAARLLRQVPETLASRPKSTYSANSINVIIKSQYI